MSRGNTWSNPDGLVVGFGTHSSDNDVQAEAAGGGLRKSLQMEINGVDLVDTFAIGQFRPQDIILPRGTIIIRATFQTIVAFSGTGSPTLDIGTFTKGLATDVVDDADGLVADMSVAELTSVGEVHVLDGGLIATSGTTAVGAIGDGNCVIAPSYETDDFEAGKGILTVEYQVPALNSGGQTIAAVN